jgi:hypothetical protein
MNALTFTRSALLTAFLTSMLMMNTVTANDNDGWIVLFDGSNTDEWRRYNSDGFPAAGWNIEGDELVFRPTGERGPDIGGDIMTRRIFQDFDLRLEWLVEEGGNSGIFYHVLEQPDKAIYWSGLEYQILDDENHPDSFRGVDGNRQAASLYDLLPIYPKTVLPAGQWNEARIVSKGPIVEHWLNGEMVLRYERWTVEWFAMLRESKFREHNEFGAMQQGHIGLQDHGDVVKFRNIRIREL